jgi:hypothetical protein
LLVEVELRAGLPVAVWVVVPVPLGCVAVLPVAPAAPVGAAVAVVAAAVEVVAAAWVEAEPLSVVLGAVEPAGAPPSAVRSVPVATVPLGAVVLAAVGAPVVAAAPVPVPLPVGLALLVSAFVVVVVEDAALGPAVVACPDPGWPLEVPVCVLVVAGWLPVELSWLLVEVGWTPEAVDWLLVVEAWPLEVPVCVLVVELGWLLVELDWPLGWVWDELAFAAVCCVPLVSFALSPEFGSDELDGLDFRLCEPLLAPLGPDCC